jgi:dTMP kinase
LEERVLKGLFITLEGPEGSGKSTQASRIEKYVISLGIPCVRTREPGGTSIGDRIRGILLDPEADEMKQRTEMLLYAASRAQLVEEVIRPALAAGKVVLCDRFVDSSLVYQGYGPQWDMDEVLSVNRIATGGLVPDRTYLLDLSVEESAERLVKRGKGVDRIEQKGEAFHRRVREGFLELARVHPQRYCVIDAAQPVDQVFEELRKDLDSYLQKRRASQRSC